MTQHNKETLRKMYAHEIKRITQFKEQAKDEEHFRQKLLTRAGRCSQEKLHRFIEALKAMELNETAGFIQGVMIRG